MRRTATVLVVAFLLAMTSGTHAADTEVHGRLYAFWMMDLSEGAGNYNEFALDRAYITVRSKLSEYTSVRLTTDLREAAGFDGYSIVLKYAHLDWKPAFGNGIVALRFGLQPTPYIDMMNKLWGRRYLEKTIGDHQAMLTTSDLGAGLIVNFDGEGKFGYLAANIWNGTSYTHIEERNNEKDFSGFLYLTPVDENSDFGRTALQGQVYFGTRNVFRRVDDDASDWDRSLFSFGGLLAYRNTLDLGADVNFYSEGQGPGSNDIKETGYSFFGTIYLEDMFADDSPLRTLNIFGRMDMYDPNTNLDDNAETLIIGGIECVPVKGFKASVNLRNVSFQDDADSETYLYVNTLLKF